MAIRPIRLFPDPCLSRPCEPINTFDSKLAHLINDLKLTMYASPGVGLAAPQIGVSQQVSVIDVGRSKRKPSGSCHGFVVLINPVLVEGLGLQIPREGCLSIPDVLANVQRHQTVIVETLNFEGERTRIRAEGFEALAFQHEIDHLHGQLFLDRVANIHTDIFRRKNFSTHTP